MRNATVTTVLDAPQREVFDYMADIHNLPEWATEFARELRREGDDYKVLNGLGEFYFAIRADPSSGVIDMYAGPSKEAMAVFPTRTVSLPDGRTAFSFTIVPGSGHARGTVRVPARVAQARIRQHRAALQALMLPRPNGRRCSRSRSAARESSRDWRPSASEAFANSPTATPTNSCSLSTSPQVDRSGDHPWHIAQWRTS
jgi:hypothetical protein